MKPIIALFTDLKTEHVKAIRRMAPDYEVKVSDDIEESDDEIIEIIFGWDNDYLTEERLLRMPLLKWIQINSAGLDRIPLSIRKNSEYLISNMSGIHAEGIAEHVFGYLLFQARGHFEAWQDQQEKVWRGHDVNRIVSLRDKTMIVFGAGEIGQEIARKAQAFDMNMIGVNSDGRETAYFDKMTTISEANAFVTQADYVLNAFPLTEMTHHFYDEAFFAQMKKEAHFINIGRGASVVESALQEVLNEEKIAGAYLDVFETEPVPKESLWWQTKNVFMTPHTSGTVEHYRDALYTIFTQNLAQYLEDGQLAMNQYRPQRGY